MHRMLSSLPTADTADFTFTIFDPAAAEGEDAGRLKVVGFTGAEGLSELYQFRVELCSDDASIDPAQMVGRDATLTIAGGAGKRRIHGIVRACQRAGQTSDGTSLFVAELVPVQWLLTRRITCWIHQDHNTPDMSVPGIVRQVLLDSGIPADMFRFALERTYPKRDFVVQYRESEFDFIAR